MSTTETETTTETSDNPDSMSPSPIFAQMASRLTSLLTPESEKPKEDANPEGGQETAKPDAKPADTAAPEPKAAAKPETKPDLESTTGMSVTSAEKFNHIKKTRDELKTKAETFERTLAEKDAELTKLRSQVQTGLKPDTKELDTLKQENDRLTQIVRELDVERHPQFQAHYGGKMQQAIGRAKAIVGEAQSARIESVLNLPDNDYKDQQLEELVSDLSEIKRGRLAAVLNEIDQIKSERSTAIQREKENYERSQQDHKSKVEASKNSVLQSFQDRLKSAQDPKNGWPVFQKRDGDDTWNAEVDQRVTQATAFMQSVLNGQVKPEAFNEGVLRMFSLGPILQQLAFYEQEMGKMKEQLAARANANPNPQGGGTRSGPNGESGSTKPEGFIDAYKKAMGR